MHFKKIKKISILALSIIFTLSIVACSNKADSEDGEVKELVAATDNPSNSLLTQALEEFSSKLEEKTDGDIKIEVHTDGTMGGNESLYDSAVSGDIDLIYTDPGWFAEANPAFNILESNYLFEDQDHFDSVVNDSDDLEPFEDLLIEDAGLKTVMYAGGLERDIISTFPIESVEDLNGHKMRSGGTSSETKWWEDLGANPTTVDFDELYSAMQTNVAEGSQNSLDAMLEQRLGEVGDYVAQTQHKFTLGFVVMNNDLYESLNEDEKEAVESASEEVQSDYIDKAFDEVEDNKKELEEEFDVTFTDVDKEGFIEKSRKQTNELAQEYNMEKEVNNIMEK